MIGERRTRIWLPAGLACGCAVLGWGLYANLSAPIGEAAARADAGGALIVLPLPAEAEFAMPELAAFRETLERPLFVPSRRPEAAPTGPAVTLQPIGLVLRGVILNGETRIALLASPKDNGLFQLKPGERYLDWTLAEVEASAATFVRGGERRTLAILFEEAPPKPPAQRTQTPEQRGAVRQAPPAAAPAAQPRAGQNQTAVPPAQPQDVEARTRAAVRQRQIQQQQQQDADVEAGVATPRQLVPER